jgi:hypothetical protein
MNTSQVKFHNDGDLLDEAEAPELLVLEVVVLFDEDEEVTESGGESLRLIRWDRLFLRTGGE